MSGASGEALSHLVDHVAGRDASWLGRPRLVAAPQTDRCLTLIDDAIAWVCATRNADTTSSTVASLPLMDFLR